MDPYYNLSDDEEEVVKEWVEGFSVPYRLRHLLPIIDAAHISTLWTAYKLRQFYARIPDILMIYPNSQREDYTAEEIYFDDEEQYTYTRKLQQEDILRNEGYAKFFAGVMISPVPFFVVRLWVRVTFIDIICMISLLISAWSTPAVRTDSLAVILPGLWKLAFIRFNIFLSSAIAVGMIFAPPGREMWNLAGANLFWMDDITHFGMLPLIMAVISHAARRFMEAVSMMEMEYIRYSYLPKSRGGISDLRVLPHEPPGPPPELPSVPLVPPEVTSVSPEVPLVPPVPPVPVRPVRPEVPQEPPSRPSAQQSQKTKHPRLVELQVALKGFHQLPKMAAKPSPMVTDSKAATVFYSQRKTWHECNFGVFERQRDILRLIVSPPAPEPERPPNGNEQYVSHYFMVALLQWALGKYKDINEQLRLSGKPQMRHPPPPINLSNIGQYGWDLDAWASKHWETLEKAQEGLESLGKYKQSQIQAALARDINAFTVWQDDQMESYIQMFTTALKEMAALKAPMPE